MPSVEKAVYTADSTVEKIEISNNNIAFCTLSKLFLGKISDFNSLKVEKEYNLASSVLSINISTSGLVACTLIDGSLMLFEYGKELQLIKPSRNLLNDVDINEKLIATTGDDKLVTIFNLDSKTSDTFPLRSRGVVCKFNKRYPSHLLIGEVYKISLYDMNSRASVFSIPVINLVSLDWHNDPAILNSASRFVHRLNSNVCQSNICEYDQPSVAFYDPFTISNFRLFG
jgi:hypothetical protein